MALTCTARALASAERRSRPSSGCLLPRKMSAPESMSSPSDRSSWRTARSSRLRSSWSNWASVASSERASASSMISFERNTCSAWRQVRSDRSKTRKTSFSCADSRERWTARLTWSCRPSKIRSGRSPSSSLSSSNSTWTVNSRLADAVRPRSMDGRWSRRRSR